MANTTDPRYSKRRFEGAAGPRKYSAPRGGANASRTAFAEGEKKNQYVHKVTVTTEPRARKE